MATIMMMMATMVMIIIIITNSALLQTANKFKKSFQTETKQIKNIITQNIKEKKDAWTVFT
jgi:hypothetical protein